MSEIEITNQVIFLSNKLIDEKQLCDSFYQISRSFPQVSISIDEISFHKYFNLKVEKMEEMYLSSYEKNCIKEMEEITNDFL